MDFTLKRYTHLLESLLKASYTFQSFEQYIKNPLSRVIILRHDIDRLPQNSLNMARLESSLDIKGTYYFRTVPNIFNEVIIRQVAEFGHEVGYHYETMDTVSKRLKSKKVKDNDLLIDAAYEEFCRNLELFRKLIPIVTVCMHGSPLSKYDNKAIWIKYDYQKLGIIAEPYFDVDFSDVLYLTDTGRRWDGDTVNIRDKMTEVEKRGRLGKREWGGQKKEIFTPNITHRTPIPRFHSTFDIIKAAEENRLPDKIMMTFHPQRWNNMPIPWVKELIWQNVKNIGKYFLVKMRR